MLRTSGLLKAAAAAWLATAPLAADIVIDGDFKYTSPRLFSYWVPGNAFQSTEGIGVPRYRKSVDGYGFPETSTFMGLTAPVHLPDGATLDTFACYHYDNALPGQISGTMKLKARKFDSATSATVAEVSFTSDSESTAPVLSFIDVFTPPTVDQYDYAYYIFGTIGTTATTEELRFYGCVIDYTVTSLNP